MQIYRFQATNSRKSIFPQRNWTQIDTLVQEDHGYNILKNWVGLSIQKKVMGKKVQKKPILPIFWGVFAPKMCFPQSNATKIDAEVQKHQGYNILKNCGGLSFQKKVMGK